MSQSPQESLPHSKVDNDLLETNTNASEPRDNLRERDNPRSSRASAPLASSAGAASSTATPTALWGFPVQQEPPMGKGKLPPATEKWMNEAIASQVRVFGIYFR